MAVPAPPLDPRVARPGGVLVHLSGWYPYIWGTFGVDEKWSGWLDSREHIFWETLFKVSSKFSYSLNWLPRMGFRFLDYRTVGW